MIIKNEGMVKEVRENMRGGGGRAIIMHALSKEALPPKFRLLGQIVLEKGCGIGRHEHVNEAEMFFVLQGEGVYDDNGTECILNKGDFSVTYSGQHHAVRNIKDEALIILAAIITE